jgi:uncharacterized protein (TIGR02453 family)
MPLSAEAFPPPPFEGFSEEAFRFFRELAANQSRSWFEARKGVYDDAVRTPLTALVADLSDGLAAARLPLRGEPKRSVFRINRDVRFSADKSPYKTHAGVALTRNLDKSAPGVLYFHLDPLGCFSACGFFQPEPAVLHLLRSGMVERRAEWRQVEKSLARHGLALSTEGALVRPPKGFDGAPEELADALKLKSWVVRIDLPNDVVLSPALTGRLVAFAKQAAPLLEFGWSAIDGRIDPTKGLR